MLRASVLDLSPVSAGRGEAAALRETVQLAVEAERLGYHRFWLAEHHGGAMVSSSSPEIMIDRVATATGRIRVGSGGVMLPNHNPLHVAEQFKVLEALHPGRIDLGIGRAPGTDQLTAMALRYTRQGVDPEDLPARLGELLAFAGLRPWPDGHPFASVRAAPQDAELPPIWLLGSSDFSARLAAGAGLGYAFAAHINPALTVGAMRLYRDRFEPSELRAEPASILAIAVVCAADDEAAERLAAPARVAFRRLRSGRPQPLPAVEEAIAVEEEQGGGGHERLPVVDGAPPRRMIAGGPETVRDALGRLVEATGADEVMLMTNVHRLEDRVRSYELVAEALELSEAPASRR